MTIEVQQKKIYLHLRVDPTLFDSLPKNVRDVTNIGHFGTGNLEYTLRSEEGLEEAMEWVRKAFEEVGG